MFDNGFKFRCIGPPRGGRVLAVHGHPTEPMTFYFGGCAGGIWKTEDAGTYWENISDGFLESAAVGALTVSQSDPNVIYAGMGESTIRLDVSYGNGVYRSSDAGKTWQHLGLDETKHISEIRVHPQNPDLVYVAAFGHAFGDNPERGIYRSQNGGQSWELVLHKSEQAGAADLAMDMTNPRILYASMYQARRSFWNLSSGGPDSGLWRTTDSGDSWVDLTENPGMPKGIKGKIGVAVSPANPERVWAIIECEKAGLYRSDDGGDTWTQVSDNRDLIHRPWYYCHVFADPQDENTVYITNLKMWKSTDGGQNFFEVTTPHGDNHDLWIDPNNPQRMIEGNDGGACVSFNGGTSWSTIYNQLTAQFYHVAVDNRHPYQVYGTQQDNSSISVPSATEKGAIPWQDCYAAGTGESGYIVVHPEDDDIVYVGAIGSSPGGGNALQRYDHRTKQVQLVTVWPEVYYGQGAQDMKYRFSWTYPILFSPHDANVLYVGGNHVFRTENEGNSWTPISPDLSRNDQSKLQPPGGPITLDTSGAETYATVFALAESTHEAGVLWAGTDDGLVHITRDGGANWQEITPPDLPELTLISMIELSTHDPATAYMAATRYKLDDYAPYLYKTSDYGATWQRLDSFPASEITRCVREDSQQQGLLFVGTETGIYISLDGGGEWQRLQAGLPIVPVYDLVIKDDDLVVGTHGRSFWILDDISPLRQTAAAQVAKSQANLFTPRTTVRNWEGFFVGRFGGDGKNYMLSLGATVTYLQEKTEDGEPYRTILDGGQNPARGALIYYSLPETVEDGSVKLTLLDSEQNEIRSYFSKQKDAEAEEKPAQTVPAKAGLNRFVWNMHYPDAEAVPGDIATKNAATGPLATPGLYHVQLSIGDKVVGQEQFEIVKDPRVAASQEDLNAQFELWNQITQKVSDTHQGIHRLRRMRGQIQGWNKSMEIAGEGEEGQIRSAATVLCDKLDAIETQLIQTKTVSERDRLRMPAGLNAKLTGLIPVILSADARPTQQSYDVFGEMAGRVDEQLSLLDGLIGDDIAAFNDMVRQANVEPVVVM